MSSETDIRVLLVSTEPALIRELSVALGAESEGGFQVELAANAREAIVALRRLPSELTLVDIADGGPERLHELQLVGATTVDTALIAITSNATERVIAATFEQGAHDCLISGTDDLTAPRLARCLNNALARSAHDGSRPLATLIELSSDAILTLNRDRVITRFNGAAETLYGWGAAEVLGKPVQILIPASEHGNQLAFVDRVFGGESVDAFEIQRTMRDGRQVIMSMGGSPIVDVFGDVLEACIIIRDVTDEVNARLRVVEQQHLLESSQAAGRIGSWAVDHLTGRMDWSAEQYRLVRRDPSLGPATVEELLHLVHPDDRDSALTALTRSENFSFEARLVADPDDVRILRVRGEYIPREGGEPGRLLGITQDVTDERAEQDARQRAEEQLRRSFDEALIGMSITELDGRPLRVNNALCEIFGLTRVELLTRTFRELTHPDDRGDEVPMLEALLERGQKHYVREKRYIHADGHTIWAEVGVSLVTTADGTSHLVGQVQDITERRAHLEHLRHMADHDPLTGLLNRRAFGRELSSHIARSQRYGVSGALLMFDLDNFKQHNDAHGHGAGDELLIALAECLRARLRATDVTCRLGGDEFAALLPNADPTHARLVTESLLEHIRGIVSRREPVPGDNAVTASIGLVCLDRLEALTPEGVMRAADQAMYEAKRCGRNRSAEWQPTSDGFIPASE
ncbi:MAG TPA: PAS domain S-box protein [Solirubrobacteraceae bacterium]|nr:PAS domain S-box protein [Solirubrobacteraceae bacterium]